VYSEGALGKPRRKRLAHLGYQQRCQRVNVTAASSAVDQVRLAIIYVRGSSPLAISINHDMTFEPDPGSRPRPMENLLRPPGLVPRAAYQKDAPSEGAPIGHTDPMPSPVRALIQDSRGIRKLQADYLAKGLGVPSWSASESLLQGRHLNDLPGIHLWEWLGYGLFAKQFPFPARLLDMIHYWASETLFVAARATVPGPSLGASIAPVTSRGSFHSYHVGTRGIFVAAGRPTQ
jgi:hypothetical protein